MHFWIDDPARSAEVTYYFVPPDRLQVPQPNWFGPRVWLRNEPIAWPELGEEKDYHPYFRGNPISTANGLGVCGSASAWAEGVTTATPVPPIDPNTGLPVCCRGPVLGVGGLALGGDTEGARGVCDYPLPAALTFQLMTSTPTGLYGGPGFHALWDGAAYRIVEKVPILGGGDLSDAPFVYDAVNGYWTLFHPTLAVGGLTYLNCPARRFDNIQVNDLEGGTFKYAVFRVLYYWWQLGYGQGGYALGGFAFKPAPAPRVGEGGYALGGVGELLHVELGEGGYALGGVGELGARAIAQGGYALGGYGVASGILPSSGGLSIGGDGTP